MPLPALTAMSLEGEEVPLTRFAGRVLLIVNVASQCGFTPQYTALESLWRRYQAQGLTVLGFPCNQFGQQEPGNAEAIRAFCATRYDISFPLFARVDVNGPGTHPVFAWLKAAAPGILGTTAVKWNFTKFLVAADGQAVRRYGSVETPERIAPDIEALLPHR
jgi:glutathione peroxidase